MTVDATRTSGPWPVPKPRLRERLGVLGLVVDAGLVLLTQGQVAPGVYGHASFASVPRRWERLHRGGAVKMRLRFTRNLVDGALDTDSYQPARLQLDGLVTQTRPALRIPLQDLQFVALRPLGSSGTWAVDMRFRSTGESAAIGGDLIDLALVAGVAGWPAPDSLPEREADRSATGCDRPLNGRFGGSSRTG